MVYKLVEINKAYRIKFSNEIFKATLPGKKNSYRIWVEGSDKVAMDVLAFADEKIEIGK
jgi:translation initiation factor IF-1